MPDIRVRIAPSPTGLLHIGTARTALFNYLFAKHVGGTFVLRIEDTDIERSKKEYEQNIFDGLQWLGIDSNEGPEQGGPFAPYRQSERIETYTPYIQKLLDSGKAFYCFHSEQELEEEKQSLMAEKKPPLHMCEFRTMDPTEAAALTETKTNYIIRFKTPAGKTIRFTDLIRGELEFQSDLMGDFSIAKKVDVPLYNFAVVIDDYEMKISHVIRGEDHISNTPKQLLLIEAMGFNPPEYAHLPLILGPDRSKLSKRHGATSIDDYRQQGYLSDTLFNFIALIGWNPGTEQEIFTKEELAQLFSIEHVQKSGAIFDVQKLDWMNGEFLRAKSIDVLMKLCEPYIASLPHIAREKMQKIVALEQPRLKKLSEIGERIGYFFQQPEYDKELLRWKKMSDQDIMASLAMSFELLSDFSTSFSRDELERVFLEKIGEGDKGSILWPLRVALSGKKASPGPFDIMDILGKEETLARIAHAQKGLE